MSSLDKHPADTAKDSRYAEFEDIDFDSCLADLDTHLPGYALESKLAILKWVIYWHYMR